jgi:UDP-glucose 4-epimerase
VPDLVRAHCDALAYLRGGDVSATLNCGYGGGFPVLEVIETVKRVSGVDFKTRSRAGVLATPHRSWRLPTVPVLCSNGSRISTTWKPPCATRWRGSASF